MRCFKNTQQVNNIDVFDRAFHYGDGCFTTARIRHNQIELYQRHLQRLALTNAQLYLHADLTQIQQTLQKLIALEGELNGTVKIVLSRGVGQRGYSLPNTPADVWLFYYPSQLTPFVPKEMKSAVLQQRLGLAMPALVGLKTLNRLDQVMLKKELDDLGLSEALVCDVNDHIVEGVSSNCFMLVNGQWITPELRYNGVHGVMRAEIIERMRQVGIDCEIRCIALDELQEIQSLFFCNALTPMLIVSSLADRTLDTATPHALFHQLQLNQIR